MFVVGFFFFFVCFFVVDWWPDWFVYGHGRLEPPVLGAAVGPYLKTGSDAVEIVCC